MRLAVIGSRNVKSIDLAQYIPEGVTEMISGGARGVDTFAAAYANQHGIPLTIFLPDYRRYGRGAPLRRNLLIIERADLVLAFWDGKSTGTKFVIECCNQRKIPIRVILIEEKTPPID